MGTDGKLADGAQRLNITCYDRQPTSGGQWTGQKPFSSMYKGMWLNGHYVYTQFASYTYAEHYSRDIPGFFPRQVATDYIAGFIQTRGVEEFITHSTEVTSLWFDEEREQFGVKKAPVDPVDGSVGPESTQAEYYDYVTLGLLLFLSLFCQRRLSTTTTSLLVYSSVFPCCLGLLFLSLACVCTHPRTDIHTRTHAYTRVHTRTHAYTHRDLLIERKGEGVHTRHAFGHPCSCLHFYIWWFCFFLSGV